MARKKIEVSEIEEFFIRENSNKGIDWLQSKLPALPKSLIEKYIIKPSIQKEPTPFVNNLAIRPGQAVIMTEGASMVADEDRKRIAVKERPDCVFKPNESKRSV